MPGGLVPSPASLPDPGASSVMMVRGVPVEDVRWVWPDTKAHRNRPAARPCIQRMFLTCQRLLLEIRTFGLYGVSMNHRLLAHRMAKTQNRISALGRPPN